MQGAEIGAELFDGLSEGFRRASALNLQQFPDLACTVLGLFQLLGLAFQRSGLDARLVRVFEQRIQVAHRDANGRFFRGGGGFGRKGRLPFGLNRELGDELPDGIE